MSTRSANDPEFNDALPKPSPGGGFKIVRVLMALGIIAILLVVLFLPAVRTAGPAARRTQCVNNLKQIGLAIHNYEQFYKSLPPAYTVDESGRPLHSWRTLILPYLEEEALYQTIDLSKPWNDPANAKAMETVVPAYHCPEAGRPLNTTTYLAISGPNACFNLKKPRRLAEVTDAHELTLMLIEAGEEKAVPWMAPVDADESLVLNLGSTTELHHRSGMNACLVDGRVTFLSVNVQAKFRQAMMSIAGNDNDFAKEPE